MGTKAHKQIEDSPERERFTQGGALAWLALILAVVLLVAAVKLFLYAVVLP